jgi:endoglucanase
VPLYAAWGRASVPDLMTAFSAYWSAFPAGATPAWVDLDTDATAPYAAGAGMMAVARAAISMGQRTEISEGLPPVSSATDYYGAALIMLSRIAWRESQGNGRGTGGG